MVEQERVKVVIDTLITFSDLIHCVRPGAREREFGRPAPLGMAGQEEEAMEKGDIDFLWKGVSQAVVEDLTQDPQIRVPMALDSGYRYLGFNLRKLLCPIGPSVAP